MKLTQIVDNEVLQYLEGSGAAINAEASSIVFNGPVTLARNNNPRGAGGACYLKRSIFTFNGAASVQNNSASGWNEVSGYDAIAALLNSISMLVLYLGDHAADGGGNQCGTCLICTIHTTKGPAVSCLERGVGMFQHLAYADRPMTCVYALLPAACVAAAAAAAASAATFAAAAAASMRMLQAQGVEQSVQ
jgi:hypothetical protein